MKAFQMDVDELIKQDRPAIIWWLYNHWVLFCGMNDNGKVVVCNPNMGRYSTSVGNFKSFYTGIALFNGEPQNI